jgi:hypothetical protein
LFAAVTINSHAEGHRWVCGCGTEFVVVSNGGRDKRLVEAMPMHAATTDPTQAAAAAESDRGMSEPLTYNETRFACHCGRFLADSAIRSTPLRDDSRHYGIRDEIEWDCSRCGVVKGEEWEPQIVVTATRTLTAEADQ